MLRYILLIPIVFFGDKLIKNKAEACLSGGKEKDLFHNNIRLKLFRNKGAMLNTGDAHPERVAYISVSLCVALSVIFIMSLFCGRVSRFRVALSMLLGGAWSNAYDRLKRGYVVDYVSFPFLGKLTACIFGEKAGRFVSGIVFNISDFFIIAGCIMTAVFA